MPTTTWEVSEEAATPQYRWNDNRLWIDAQTWMDDDGWTNVADAGDE